MVLYCMITGLAVYYLALWGWYRHVAARNRTIPGAERKETAETVSLVGETRFRSGLMRTNGDICGHSPQTVENDTTFAPDVAAGDEETDFEMTFETEEETDYEDEEIAGYMADDEAGQATGVEFEKLGEAVRTANAQNPAEADRQQAAETFGSITGTNLYDAVVANINGGQEKVAELLKRNEAAMVATPTAATEENGANEEYETFNMNEFL